MNLWTILSPSNKAIFDKYYKDHQALRKDYVDDLMANEYIIHIKFETILSLKSVFSIKHDADLFKLFHIIPRPHEIEDVVVSGIDHKDYPDYCDAYIESASWNGKELDEHQMELFSEKYPDEVYEMILGSAIEG